MARFTSRARPGRCLATPHNRAPRPSWLVTVNSTSEAMTQQTGQSAQAYVSDPRNEAVLVYLNGEFVPRAQAKVSIFDAGFGLGDGVWEGLRLVQGKLAFLEEHLTRLYEGARTISLNIKLSKNEITTALEETIAANRMSDGVHIRLMVTRGEKHTVHQDPRN